MTPMQSVAESLRAGAKRFGEAYPTLAGALLDGQRDPTLECVSDGVAYLSATLLEELELEAWSSFGDFAESVAPTLLRPEPATALVEVRDDDAIESGQELHGSTGDGVRTVWTALGSVPRGRAEIRALSAARRADGTHVLRFELERTGAIAEADVLPFAVLGPIESALSIRQVLLTGVERSDASATAIAVERFDAGNDARSPLAAYALGSDLHRVLQLRLPAGQGLLRVEFALATPLPASCALEQARLVPRVVGMRNAFSARAEPIRLGPARRIGELTVAGDDAKGAEPISVTEVRALWKGGSATLLPRHQAAATSSLPPHLAYAFRCEPISASEPSRWTMELLAAEGPSRAIEAVLSVGLLATHGQHAEALSEGTTLFAPGTNAPLATLRSRPQGWTAAPVRGPSLARRFVSRVAVRNAPSRADARAYVRSWIASQLPPLRPIMIAKLEAIESATFHRTVKRGARGSVTRGMELRVVLDERAFSGPGDVALFGELLWLAISQQSPQGVPFQLMVVSAASKASLSWGT